MATAADSQGIMALPMEGAPADTGAPAQTQLSLDDSYDAVQQGLQNASPEASQAVNAELAKLTPMLDQLPDEVLDQLLQIVQYMHDTPEKYAQLLKDLINAGIVDQGDFPEEYDPEFLATLGMVVTQAIKTRQGAQQAAMPIQEAPVPPAGMARGGIAEAAHMVASRGRGKDTMLAHITPREAQMLRSKGGMGTINPATGLPEYGWFSDTVSSIGGAVSGAVKSITGAVKEIVSSPIGKVLATVAMAYFIGPAAFGTSGAVGVGVQMGLASGAVAAMGGGNLKDVLKSAAIGGATGFFGAPGGPVANWVGSGGGAITNAAANAAISSGIVGTGIGLLSGQKLQDAVKSGLTAGAISGLSTGASKGFDAQIDAPKLDTVAEMAKNQAGKNISGDALSNPNSAGVSTGQTQMTNPDGTPRVELFNGRPSNMFQNQDGSITYKAVPLADRMGPPSSSPVSGQNVAANGQQLSPLTGQNVAPTATDPLGDFIQKNDAERIFANTPAAPPPPPPPAPEVGGLEGIYNKAKGLYNEYISPTGIKEAAVPNAEAAGQAAYDRNPNLPESVRAANYQRAYDAAMPGVFSTYAPAIGAGLGIASLTGAFTPKPPQPTEMQNSMNQRLASENARVAANPGSYAPQGLERFGIKYNDRGEIIGSQPWSPDPPSGPTEVAGDYMPYTPSPYMTPSGAIGGTQPIPQPYNTARMYSNLMPPQYRADGGIASLAKGGYPRRTGPISGPGTETSDSIPAMLSDGEFVMTAKAVRGAGKGSRLAGAKKMYALMHQLERNAARG